MNAGLNSRIILRSAYDLVKEEGYHLVNADITVMCERPKITPHSLKMQQNLADELAVELNAISIKATTTEKLGFTGRQEGIMVSCVVLIEKD